MATTDQSVDLKPKGIKIPKLYTIIRLTQSGTVKDAAVRVSRDVPSAHAFAQAFLINQYPYLYTELAVAGISHLPFPDTVFLATAQKKPWDLRSMGMGLCQTLEDAKDACGVMASKDPEFKHFEIKECKLQLGLTEEDDDYLDELAQRGQALELADLEKQSDAVEATAADDDK